MSAANDMRQALVLLTKAMNSMSVAQAGPRRRRRRRAGGSTQVVPVPMTLSSVPSSSSRRRRKRRGKAGSANSDLSQGLIRLQRRELVKVVKADASGQLSDSFDITPGTMSFLAALSKSFERSKWHRVRIYWKPLVGGMVGGLVTLGVDWDFAGSAPDRTKISSYSPNMSWALREDTETAPLVLPPARLASRLWYLHNSTTSDYPDRGPGKIWVVGSTSDKDSFGGEVGEIWVDYDITMAGTCPA